MKIAPAWVDLDRLLSRLGLKPIPFRLNAELKPWVVINEELGLDEIVVPPPGEPYRFKGRAVFIYIRDTRLKHPTLAQAERNPEDYTRIHLTECPTIEQKRAKGEFERYVMTDQRSGALPYNLKAKDGRLHQTALELFVCMNCLQSMNWQGYAEPATLKRSKKHIWRTFSREEFLGTYSPAFVALPTGRDTDPPDDYTGDWPIISRQVRERRDFRCEACGVRVPPIEAALLDVHHRDHRKRNNSLSNLQVLCKLCHTTHHGHYPVKSTDRQRLLDLRHQQRIAPS